MLPSYHITKNYEKLGRLYEKEAIYINRLPYLTFVCYLTPPDYVYTTLSGHYLLQIIKDLRLSVTKASNPLIARALTEKNPDLSLTKLYTQH